MKTVRNFLIVMVILATTSVAHTQNKDIEWLRKMHVERNPNLDPTFNVFSHSIFPAMFGAPMAVFGAGFIKKDSALTRQGLVMVGALCLNSVLTFGLKVGVNRPRPFVTYPEIQKLSSGGSHSFPSGHSSGAFATATSLSLTFPRWYVIAPSFVWASAVAYSRMHLGVHYPSDVAVGALIGVGSALASHWINKKIRWTRKKNWLL